MANELRRKLSELEELDENIISGKPWAEAMLNRAYETTKKSVLHWCHFINKIGDELNIEENVAIFEEQVERVYEELILDIETVHEKYVDKVLQTLQQMEKVCKDLRLDIPNFEFEGIPLGELHKKLLTRCSEYEAQAESRKTELDRLHKRLEDACKAMGILPEFLPESPLPTDDCLDRLRKRVEELESEKMARKEKFLRIKDAITDIVRELDLTPTLDFERDLLTLDDNQVMLTDVEMEQLNEFHVKVLRQKQDMKEQMLALRVKVDELWNRLEIDFEERDAFRRKYRGISVGAIEAFQLEVKRCEELKKSNIKLFIDKQRQELAYLWDKCHCSDQDRLEFPFYDSNCYTEDLLELHEREIDKWKTHYEQNTDLYEALKEHKSCWIRRLDLETNIETGPNRYKNRGGQLLTEEKIRNRLSKKIPKLEENIVRLANSFRIRHGKEFRTHGKTVEEYISNLHEDFDKEFKDKLSFKKMQREQQQSLMSRSKTNLLTTPCAGSNPNLLATPKSAATVTTSTGAISKREKLAISSTTPSRTTKTATATQSVKLMPAPVTLKLNTSKARSARKARKRNSLTRLRSTSQQNEEQTPMYLEFEKDLITRDASRSTAVFALPKSGNPESNDHKQKLLETSPKAPITRNPSKSTAALVLPKSENPETPPVSPVNLADIRNLTTPRR